MDYISKDTKKHQDLNDTKVSPKTTSDNALNASDNNISQDNYAVNSNVVTGINEQNTTVNEDVTGIDPK